MPARDLTPYLFFNGTADKAIQLYTRVLGAKAEVMRFKDAPPGAFPYAPEDANRVMHALLTIGPVKLMLSDTTADQPEPEGGNVQLHLELDDLQELQQKFDALAAGGKVTMPLGDAFWGARFGALVDAYGIRWMMSCALPKK
jgi:PhnB protein